MSDDIIERLREQVINRDLCDEAAEEIERLRSDRDHFKEDWRAMIDQTDNLEHALKNARKALKELNE
jgi:hypothetical protein